MTGFGAADWGYLGSGSRVPLWVCLTDKQIIKDAALRSVRVLLCVHVNTYFTFSSSLDSFLFSSLSRTLSRSYFSVYSVSNSSRSL